MKIVSAVLEPCNPDTEPEGEPGATQLRTLDERLRRLLEATRLLQKAERLIGDSANRIHEPEDDRPVRSDRS